MPSVDVRRVPNLDLLKTGRWDGVSGEFEFGPEHLASAVEAHGAGIIRKPVVKLGHTGMGDASPALGYISALRLTEGGHTLVGDLAGVPKAIATLLPRAWPDRSVEGYLEFTDDTGRVWPFVLTALALLGASGPAVRTLKSLQDVAELYDVAAASGRHIVVAAAAFRDTDDEARRRAYSTLAAADFYTASDVEKRAPGSEYRVVEGLEPEPKLAVVEDWGAKVQILDEEILRNDVNRVDQQTVQLANQIAKKLDTRAVAALQAATIATVAVTNPSSALTFFGPEANLTISGNRPTAHFAQAQELADLEELGVQMDTLLVHPSQARALRTAYGENLTAIMESVGLQLIANPRRPAGTAFVVQGGMVGTIGWELPLTVEVIDAARNGFRRTRSRQWRSTGPMPQRKSPDLGRKEIRRWPQ